MSLQKNALCRGDARSDLRCYALQQFRESGLEVLLRSLYPSLMALHQLDATVFLLSLSHAQSCTFAEDPAHLPEGVRVTGEHALILPPMRNLSLAALTADGVYLLDDGFALWLLLGSQVDPALMTDLFGVASLEGYDVPNSGSRCWRPGAQPEGCTCCCRSCRAERTLLLSAEDSRDHRPRVRRPQVAPRRGPRRVPWGKL